MTTIGGTGNGDRKRKSLKHKCSQSGETAENPDVNSPQQLMETLSI